MQTTGDHQMAMGLWITYLILNYIGCALCAVLIHGVYLLGDKRRVTDIFLGGLCTGCFFMSATCASQCLVNAINGAFTGGGLACHLEAIFHVTSIMVQFFSIGLIGVYGYMVVMNRTKSVILTHRQAYLAVLAVWLLCILSVGLGSLTSPMYLLPSGAYCLFQFKSPVMVFWFMPIMVLSLSGVSFCYYKVFRYSSVTRANVASQLPARMVSAGERLQLKLVKKTTLFCATFAFGWGSAVIAVIYELVTNRMNMTLVIMVGLCGSLHSVIVPIAYGYYSADLRRRILSLYLGSRYAAEVESVVGSHTTPSQEIHTITVTASAMAGQRRTSELEADILLAPQGLSRVSGLQGSTAKNSPSPRDRQLQGHPSPHMSTITLGVPAVAAP